MGRPPKSVDKKTSYEWSQRHQRGEAFREIARDSGHDRRFVSMVVKDYEREVAIQDAARDSTLRDTKMAFLKQHLDLLETYAKTILDITAPPSVYGELCVNYSGESLLDVESALTGAIAWKRTPSPYDRHLPYMTGGFTLILPSKEAMALDERVARREAEHIVEALKEHLPDLWPQVEAWRAAANLYERQWKNLRDEARKIDIDSDSFETALRTALTLVSKADQDENFGRPPQLDPAAKAGSALFENGDLRDSLNDFIKYKARLEAAYNELENSLSSLQLRKDLLERRCKYCPLVEREE